MESYIFEIWYLFQYYDDFKRSPVFDNRYTTEVAVTALIHIHGNHFPLMFLMYRSLFNLKFLPSASVLNA